MKTQSKKGFTLVELLIVVAILAVIAAIAIPSTLHRVTERQNKTRVRKALSTYQTLVEKMIIENKKASDFGSGVSAAADQNDKFVISYGDLNKEVQYPLPNVGSTKNDNNKTMYDLRINMVEVSTTDGVFSLFVGFIHPDLENRYNINIR